MPILAVGQPIPPLRQALEAVPVEEKGQPLFLLQDLEGIAAQAVALSPAGLALAACFDGKRSAAEVAAVFAKNTRHLLKTEEVLGLAQDLEKSLLLETPQTQALRRKVLQEFRDSPVRKASSAGRTYPDEALALSKILGGFFKDPKGPGKEPAAEPAEPAPLGLIAPHIDFERGGPAYAWSYQALSETRPPDAVVALGVAHMSPNSPWVMTPKAFATPYGDVALHQGLYDEIRSALWYDPRDDEWVHRNEHSLELQAVWLRYLWREKTPPWVPILVSSFERFAAEQPPSQVETVEGALRKMGAALRRRALKGERIMVLAGVDLSHVGPRFGDQEDVTPEAKKLVEKDDRASLEHALRLKADDFYLSVVKDGNKRKVCGLSALYTALRLLQALAGDAPGAGKLLAYGQADDPAGGFVSFASAIFPAGGA
ncbi:MAG: AmmeMemoRadiSam system protein B [Elusimicrobia bacterium]|nr:AmmeMemoRadiSam system protein B [Elusimicrobiota bacterium]